MGLDMYLRAEQYVSGYKFKSEEEQESYGNLVEMFDMREYVEEDSPSAYVQFTVGYWRKANHIHSWFVRECQNGVDECQPTEVSIGQLEDLRDLCLRVLDSTKLVPGSVHTGTVWSKEHPQGMTMQESGMVVEDETVARELLPPESGFFFGSQDYDEWYWRDIEYTVEIIDKCIRLSRQVGYWSFIYQSSW